MRKNLSFLLFSVLIVVFSFAVIQLWSPVEDNYEVAFSISELEWIKAHPIISVAIDPDFAPYEFYDGQNAQGIAMEYLDYIEFQYGLKFEITHFNDWTSSLNALKNNQVDMLSAISRSPQRDAFTLFSEPYATIQNVVLIRQDTSSDFTEKDLGAMYVAVIKDYFAQDLLELHYPGINLYKATDISEGLRALSLGQVDAFVVDSAQAAYYIPRTGAKNLTMNENIRLGFDLPLHFGVNKNAPELRNILSKIIAGIPDDIHDQLQNKWATESFEPGVDTELIIFIVMLISIVLLSSILMVFWNTSLNTLVEAKTKDVRNEIEKRKIVEEQLNELVNAIPYPVSLKDHKGIYIYVNSAFCDLIGIPSINIIGCQDKEIYAESTNLNQALMTSGDMDVLYANRSFHMDAFEVNFMTEQKIYDVTKLPFTINEGQPKGVFSFFVDVTELYTAQNSLKDLNDHLEEIIEDRLQEYTEKNNVLTNSLSDLQVSEQTLINLNSELKTSLDVLETTQNRLVEVEKFAAMGRSSSAISHEMNTPLGIGISAASYGQSQLLDIFKGLQSQTISKQGIVEKLERIKESTTMIGSSSSKLLAISTRLDMLTTKTWVENVSPLNLRSFLESHVAQVMEELVSENFSPDYNVDLSIDCPEDIVIVKAPEAIHTLLKILIWNTHIHGFVAYKNLKSIHIKCSKRANTVTIIYSDSGVGVKPEDIPHILEPLFTSKRSSGSLGLGLSIIYNIVVLNYKGKLSVFNSEAGGLIVHIELPVD